MRSSYGTTGMTPVLAAGVGIRHGWTWVLRAASFRLEVPDAGRPAIGIAIPRQIARDYRFFTALQRSQPHILGAVHMKQRLPDRTLADRERASELLVAQALVGFIQLVDSGHYRLSLLQDLPIVPPDEGFEQKREH